MTKSGWMTIVHRLALCFLVVFLVEKAGAELTIQISNSTSWTFVAYPIIYPNNFRNETITGEIVLYNATDVTDKIVLSPVLYNRMTYQRHVRYWQGLNARAVIISSGPGAVPGQATYILDGTSKEDLFLPAWQISYIDFNNLTAAIVHSQFDNTPIIAVVSPAGDNPWERFNDTVAIFFQVVISAFSLANLGLCVWRLIGHFKADRCQRKLIRVCFSFIIVGNAVRFIFYAVDPIWSRQIYPVAPQHLFLTFSHTFTLSVAILITFYWHDMMRGLSLDINQLLGKVKYLFVAIIVFLFVVELTMSILRSLLLFPTATMLLVHAIVYMATCTAFAIFFFVTAGRLLKTMAAREAPEKRKSKKANLVRVTTIIVVIGVCMLGQLAIFIVAANPAWLFTTAQGAVWFCSYFLLCVQDLLLILVLAPKNSKTSMHSSGMSTSTKAGTTQMQTSSTDGTMQKQKFSAEV